MCRGPFMGGLGRMLHSWESRRRVSISWWPKYHKFEQSCGPLFCGRQPCGERMDRGPWTLSHICFTLLLA